MLPRYDADNLYVALGAAGMTRSLPPSSWLQRFFELSAERLGEFRTHYLAQLIRSCGDLQVTPPADWMQRYWHASAAAFPEFSTEDTTFILRSLSRLGVTPPKAWLDICWQASAERIAVSCSPTDIAFLIYAAGKGILLVTPPESWMRQCWALSRDQLAALDVKELSFILWAAARLLPAPDAEWQTAYWNASAAKLPAFNAQGFANVMFAAGKLRCNPPHWWLRTFWRESANALPECKPQELSNLLEGLALLGIVPRPAWLSRFWEAATDATDLANALDLQGTLASCATLRIRPTDAYMERFWACSEPLLRDMELGAIVTLLRGCVTLACKPPDAWMEQFALACAPELQRLPLRDATEVVVCCCALELWSMPQLEVFWQHLLDGLEACDGVYSDSNVSYAGRALRLMYQTYQAAAVERPGLLAAPSPALMDAARASWLGYIQQVHQDVNYSLDDSASIPRHLTRLGVEYSRNIFCERSGRAINIAITNGVAQPIALEIITPARQLSDGRPEGTAALRRRVLAAHGWRVADLDAVTWHQHLTSDEERDLYLRNLLGLSGASR
jgi:hypothetical protein